MEFKPEPRVPRPLKRSERMRLREQNGGDATPEQLNKLEQSFQRERAKQRHPSHPSKASNNGWNR